MAGSPLQLQSGGSLNGLASDARSLDALRQAANADPAKAVKQVATQFEALFMQMVLKSMRDASPKSGMLDSSDQQMYTSMLDEQLAQKIAAGGTGLADVIARQLSRNLPSAPSPTATTPAMAPTATTPATSPMPAGAVPAAVAAASASAGPAPSPGAASPGRILTTLRAAAAVRNDR